MFVNGLTVADAVTDPEDNVNGLGKTAAQLTSRSIYETGLGWDFAAVWEMGPPEYPYPILKWQKGTIPVLPPGFELIEDENFAAGIGFGFEEEISLSATASTVYKSGTPNTDTPNGLTVTAPAGYNAYRWLVDGKTAGTSQSLSINAADYALGAHAVTAIVYRGTVPYSKNIVIQVVKLPDTFYVPITSVAALSAYLAGLPQNTPQTPYPVKITGLDISDFAGADDPLGGLFAALEGRYVILNLSACGGTAIADLSSSSYIGARANKNMPVSILLPDSLTSIGQYAFRECSSLASIYLPASLTTIGNYAFEYCSSLASIYLPASLTTIGTAAFRYCSSLASIYLPASLTTIGPYAFRECSSLASIELPASLTTIASFTFLNCTSLASIELPAGLTTIGTAAFRYCSSLEAIELPAGLTAIGDWAFEGCSSLASIELPSGLTTIGGYAFEGCSSLVSIELPAGLTTIGYCAFNNCRSLEALICRAVNPPSLSSDALARVAAGLVIRVPAASVDAYKADSGWSAYADKITAIP
jgi:hypothetical protein